MLLTGPSETGLEVRGLGPAALPLPAHLLVDSRGHMLPSGAFLTVFLHYQDEMQLPVGKHVPFHGPRKGPWMSNFCLHFY